MAAPSVLHFLFWLQIALRSPHPWRVVLNIQLTKAIGEQGMDSSTREQSSTITMVSSWEKRTGRMRGASSPNGMHLEMLARLRLNDVAVLNNMLTQSIGEQEMESSTCEQSSTITMVFS